MGVLDNDFLQQLQNLQSIKTYSETPAGQADVTAELAKLTPEKLYQIAANSNKPRDETSMGAIEKALRNRDFPALRAHLGAVQATRLQDLYQGALKEVNYTRNVDRSWNAAVADAPVGIVDNVGGTVLGLSSLVSPAVPWLDDKSPLRTGQAIQDWRQAANEFYSDALQQHRQYTQALTNSDDQAHKAEQDAELDQLSQAPGGSTDLTKDPRAWFSVGTRLVRDVRSSAVSTASDPTTLAQGVTDMVATMGETAAIQKGLSGIGQVAVNAALKNVEKTAFTSEFERLLALDTEANAATTGASAVARKVSLDSAKHFAEILDRAASGGAVGVTEGLGGYQQTMDDVLKRNPEDLLSTSDTYREMVRQLAPNGLPPSGSDRAAILKTAQQHLAQRAARANMLGTGVMSAAIGFVLPEVAHTDIRSSGRNIVEAWGKDVAKESLEEFLQNGTGQLVQNDVTRALIDPKQDSLESVGSQAAQAGISAGFSAGVLKGPHLFVGGAKFGGEAAKFLYDRRAGNQIAQLEQQSKSSLQSLNEQTAELYGDTDKKALLIKGAQEALGKQDLDEEGIKMATEAFDGTLNAPMVTQLPASVDLVPEELQKKVALQDDKPAFRATVVNDVATAFNTEKNEDQKAKIGVFLNDLLEPINQYSQTPKILEPLHTDPQTKQLLAERQQLLKNITTLPQVKQAIAEMPDFYKRRQEQVRKQEESYVSPGNMTHGGDLLSTKELAIQAQRDPTFTGSKVTSETLAHAIKVNGKYLSDPQRKALELARDFLLQKESLQAKGQNLDELLKSPLRTPEGVAHEAITNESAKTEKLSARQHVTNIARLYLAGRTDEARTKLQELGNFATSHNNKVEALNQSVTEKKNVPYQQYLPSLGEFRSSETNPNPQHRHAFINFNREGEINSKSLKHARVVAQEAGVLTEAHNALAKVLPDLGVKSLQAAELHPDLRKDAKVQQTPETKKPELAATQSEPKVESKPEPEKKKTEPEVRKAPEAQPTPNKERQTPDQIPQNIDKAEQEISKQEKEFGIALDAQGNEIKRWEGQEHHISTTAEEQADLAKRGDVTYTHNHPSGSVFSVDDFEHTLKSNLARLRAVTKNGEVWDLARPKEGWPTGIKAEHLLTALTKTREAAQKELAKWQKAQGFGDSLTAEQTKLSREHYNDQLQDAYNQVLRNQGINTQIARHQMQMGAQVPEIPSEPAKPKTLKQTFESLLHTPENDGKITSYFTEVFDFKKNATRFQGMENPVAVLRQAISTPEEAKKYLSEKSRIRVTQDVTNAYSQHLGDAGLKSFGAVQKIIQTNLETFLRSQVGDTTFNRALQTGAIPANVWVTGKVLNLVQFNPQTKQFEYNPALLHQAILAGLQWQLTASQQMTPLRDEEQVREALGIPEEAGKIGWELLGRLLKGTREAEAKQQIAQLVRDFWGVKADDSQPMGFTEAIPEAMAAELMRALTKAGLITRDSIELHKEIEDMPHPMTVIRYAAFNWNEKNADGEITQKSPLYAYPTLLQDMVLTEPEEHTFYGDTVPKVVKKQLGNPHVETSKESNKARANMQAQALFLDRPVVEALLGLNDKLTTRLFGHDLGDKAKYNKNDFEAKESKNRSLTNARDTLVQIKQEMDNVVGEGGDVWSLPKRYQYIEVSNNRSMMQGAYNPQANKLMRHAVVATWSTLDLTDLNGPHNKMLMLCLAQMLGQKVHRNTLEANVNWASKAIQEGGVARPAIDVMAKYLREKPAVFPVEEYLKALAGTKIASEPITFSALMNMAQIQNLREGGGDLSKFRSSMYLEADGMTNGPFNTMGLLTLGGFTKEWVESVKRGGVNFGTAPTTANELLNHGDLYQAGADNALTRLHDLARRITNQKESSSEVHGVLKNVLQAVGALFGGDVEIIPHEDYEKTGNFSIKLNRGLIKNPMTQMVYGAGAKAVARTIAGKLQSEFYKVLSQIAADPSQAENHEKILEMMSKLAASTVGQRKDGTFYIDRKNIEKPVVVAREGILQGHEAIWRDMVNSPESFTFSPQQEARIRQNLEHLLVGPMRDGITDVLGAPVMEAKDRLIRATNIQAGMARVIYLNEIKKAVDAKAEKIGAARASSEFLSRDELDAIWEKMRDVMPLVSADGQEFLMAKSAALKFWESRNTPDKTLYEYSRSLGKPEIATPPNVQAIDVPGAAAVPLSVIGMGDARMVRNVFQTALENTLQIFDGIHVTPDKITEYGNRINRAALEAWQGNIFASVNQTFREFAQHEMVKEALADKSLQAEIQSTVDFGKDIAGEKITDPAHGLQVAQDELLSAAKEAQARRVALSKAALSFDQMSATYSPFISQGYETEPGTDAQTIAERLQQDYVKELAKIEKGLWPQPNSDSNSKTPVPELTRTESRPVPAEVFNEPFSGIHDSGARVVPVTAMRKLFEKIGKDLSATDKWALGNLLKSPTLKGVQIVAGTLEQIQNYQKIEKLTTISDYTSAHPDMQLQGLYVPATVVTPSTIYLINPQVETAVHELIHAATYQLVRAFYEGKLPAGIETEAIRRLEGLKKMFMDGKDHGLDLQSPAGQALQNAQEQIQFYESLRTPYGKAGALNEFMAWSLANHELANRLSQQKVTDKLVRITQAAWNAIKKLIWKDRERAPRGMGSGTDMLSQIRFNTAILTQSTLPLEDQFRQVSLAHAVLTGTEDEPTRLQRVADAFGAQILRHLGVKQSASWLQNPNVDLRAHPDVDKAFQSAVQLREEAERHFRGMSPLESGTFRMMVAALATEARINPHSVVEAGRLYDRFLAAAKDENFIKNFLSDPDTNDPQERADARDKLAFLAGQGIVFTDKSGRSSRIPVFVALATVNDEVRKVLGMLSAKDPTTQKITGLDSLVEAAGSKSFQLLSDRLSGSSGKSENLRQAVDELTARVTEDTFRAQSITDNVMETVRHTSQGLNGKLVQLMRQVGDKAQTKAESLSQSNSKSDKVLKSVLTGISAMASERNADAVSESVLSWMDKQEWMPEWVRDLLGPAGVIGRVGSQAEIYDMYKKNRVTIDQARQKYRDTVPAVIDSKFKTQPDAETYNTLYKFARSDMMCLLDGGRTVPQVLQLVTDAKARAEKIQYLEDSLHGQQNVPHYVDLVRNKIDQLVEKMHGGRDGTNLLRNAYAISQLFNEVEDRRSWTPVKDHHVQVIDQLTTLKYLEKLAPEEHAKFQELYKNEPEAITFIANYLKGQRDGEMSKAQDGWYRYNHHKGALPYESGPGHLVVAPDEEHVFWTLRGYTRTGAYHGSPIEGTRESHSYYYSPDGAARTQFDQGLIQNIQGSAYGVNQWGASLGPNAGIIDDSAQVAKLVKQFDAERGASQSEIYGGEALSPIYAPNGRVFAFERTMHPDQLKLIRTDQHLGKMLGQWRGRQVEEVWAHEANRQTVQALGAQWRQDQGTDEENRYENLYLSKDPVVQDALRIMPGNVRTLLDREFGEGNFPVRRNQISQVIGYRSASIGDLWTGNTRISPEIRKGIRNALISVFGINAYKKLTWAEKNWQAVIASTHTNIVVRSVTVAMANTVSGLYQLKVSGVPFRDIVAALPKKLVEIENYARMAAKRVALEAEAYADPARTSIVQNQIKALDDTMRRLSIWPLIEANEFSAIANVGQIAESLGKGEGTLVEKLTEAVDQLPPGLRDAAKVGYISKDTAIFQTLQKWLQYSDFVMKSIYYDHLMAHGHEELERTFDWGPAYEKAIKTLGPEEAIQAANRAAALGKVTEAFVNYDLPNGRGRNWLESMGLAWFLTYKIRAAKVGLSMLRNNPLDLLLFGAMPHPMSGGIPFTGSILSRLFQFKLGNMLGPQLLTQPIAWNSWYNLFGS